MIWESIITKINAVQEFHEPQGAETFEQEAMLQANLIPMFDNYPTDEDLIEAEMLQAKAERGEATTHDIIELIGRQRTMRRKKIKLLEVPELECTTLDDLEDDFIKKIA